MRFIPIIIAAVSSVACAGAVKGRGELGYSAYKSSPPPANYGKVPLYGQCGAGEGKWDGPTECVPEAGAPAPVYSAPPPPPSKIPLYGQCGAGEGEWKGPTECAEGSCMAIQEYYSQCLKDAPPMYAPPPPPTETAPAKEYAPPAKGYLPPKKEYSPPAPPKYPENNGYTKHTSAYRRRQLVNSVTNNEVGLTSDPDHKLPAIPLIKAQKFGQCGGMEYSGPSVCPDAYTCKKMDDYYSQCTPLST